MLVRTGFLALLLLSGACSGGPTEIDHPFYLQKRETGGVDLIRCPRGPRSGCAVDGLPEKVLAAGANKQFVVARSSAGYFYFARVPQETDGWGNNPERVVGPLSAAKFEVAARELQLPPFEVER